ncbi:hypothetical protein LUZ61_007854 [Rhynchospora tenuis]|uniref:Peptidase A1 domain-containing protein n=1 Tax=Rhynchospora tenuis TaxID=198213 RepID=A0AAD5ZU82_9POAL|nr:hypothetical protein LUZ61_007854 [Rhynchospora tenuis]
MATKQHLVLIFLVLMFSIPSTRGKSIRKFFNNSEVGLGDVADGLRVVCGLLNLFGSPCYPGSYVDTLRPVAGSKVSAPEDLSSGAFLLNFSVGDTRQNVALIPDTTLDMTFMFCQPCLDCSLETNIPVYNSTHSDTFERYKCEGPTDCLTSRYTSCSSKSCTYSYDDIPAFTSRGFLAKDTFFLTNEPPVSVIFGCGTTNTGFFGNAVGYLGLGRGNLSFPAQLNVSVFSYCLSFDPSRTTFFFGSDAQMRTGSGFSTTLIPNRLDPTLYYVNMTGITVGGKRINIPSTSFLPQTDGTGGLIVDSSSRITLLEESVYLAFKTEIIKQLQLPEANASVHNLDLCFHISPEDNDVKIPSLTIHFDGSEMTTTNYFTEDTDGKIICLMVLPSKKISILGGQMQTDIHMIFDIGNSLLRFEYLNCDNL